MKQAYIKPTGHAMAIHVRENIAASASGGELGGGSSLYGVTYRREGDTVYISTGTYVASSTGSSTFDSFYDLVTSYVYDLTSVCRV